MIGSINRESPPEHSAWVNADREVVIALRINTYATESIPHMFHCHMLDQEVLGIMGQFLVINE